MYTQEERQIFEYKIGTIKIKADPLRIERHLAHALGGDVTGILEKCKSPDEATSFDAIEALLKAVQTAFGYVPLDAVSGQGQTEAEMWNVLSEFIAFREGEKKNSVTSAPSTPPTESPNPFHTPSSARYSGTASEYVYSGQPK